MELSQFIVEVLKFSHMVEASYNLAFMFLSFVSILNTFFSFLFFFFSLFNDAQMDKIVDGLKDDEPLLDSVLMHMGSIYSTMGKFEKSMLTYRRALGILEITYGNFKL